jgi:hypothetical protein
MAFASVGQLEADETIGPGFTVEALAGFARRSPTRSGPIA